LRGTKIEKSTIISQKWRLVWEVINQGGVGQNLCRVDLRGMDLSGINFSAADLTGANLAGANLDKANFTRTKLIGVDLRETILTQANLSSATLKRTNLRKANLAGADLRYATLSGVTLNEVDLSGADLSQTNLNQVNFSGAQLRSVNFKGANFNEVIFIGANLSEANLIKLNLSRIDFSQANLCGAILSKVRLNGANLNRANLSEANLSEANLTATQALATNFTKALFTGACIENWNINSDTQFDEVACDYIYFKGNQQERRPHDSHKTFAPGEFTKLVLKAASTVDLIFRNGINWQAFAYSFQQLRVKDGNEDLIIQTIENKGDGDFVIRVSTPPDAQKADIQRFLEQEYQMALSAIESQYRTNLQLKDEQLKSLWRENTNLWEVVKSLSSRPINIEAKAVADNQSKNVEVEMNFHAQVTGATGTNKGIININASEQKQTLAEAAAEIQRLLRQLEETNPTASEPEQVAYVDFAAKPELKERAIAALKAGGETAIDEFFLENKYLKVGKAVVKAWLQPGR
jgi:uncharacterized protein YjbI with pentapeptide repeats